MAVARWSDAGFEQERLLGTLNHNPLFRDYIIDFQDANFPELGDNPDMMLKLHQYKLQEADPMYVSQEVVDIWDYARESFQPESLHPWDLPANIVFALLPRPLTIGDWQGNTISFRALSWIPAGSGDVEWSQESHPEGLWYTLWSHIDDGGDDFQRNVRGLEEREAWEALGQWSILFSGFMPFGDSVDFEMEGMKDARENATIDEIDSAVKSRRATWLLLQSFWRLSRQIVPVREQLPRQLRRDRKRHYRTEDVTVITLRRQHTPGEFDHGDGEVDWKWQWVVRGHWRNQWYPSIKEHRQIWIMPYMKGPEDAPIKPVKRAFEFTR